VAVTLDDSVVIAPFVQSAIDGRSVHITMGDQTNRASAVDDARQLALALHSGSPLPVALELVGEHEVPPAQ
jgi:preprotein translocase subunit SecD